MADDEKNYALMPLGEILLDLGYITTQQWEGALTESDRRKVDFQDVLLSDGVVSVPQLTRALALQCGLRFWDRARIQQITQKHRLERRSPARNAPALHHVVWTKPDGPALIAISDLNDAQARDQLRAAYKGAKQVEIVAVTPDTLTQATLDSPLPEELGAPSADRRSATTDILSGPPDLGDADDTLPPGEDDVEPGTQVDNYRITQRLAAGAAGVVYLAEDTTTGTPVALKRLHPELVARARAVEQHLAERTLLQAFDHPNIITVYGGGLWDGVPYFAMELMPGTTLAERIADSEPLPIPQVMRLWCQIADALAYAHRMGVLHRDIKPANVLLTDDMDAKVVDFGIARGTTGANAQETGTAAGTLLYMAPEQLRGRPLTPAADIYALGMLAIELLTGEILDGSLDLQTMVRRRQQRDVSFDDIRRPLTQAMQRRGQMQEVGASLTDFARILHQCLRLQPRERYGSAEELGKSLRHLMQLRHWPMPPATPLPEPQPHTWSSGEDEDGTTMQITAEATAARMGNAGASPAAQETLLPPDYDVIKKLGRGSMGEVFLARDRDTGREVALKMIAPEMAANSRFRSRFQREAEVLGRLQHPSIVHIYGVQFEGATPHIAMEYIQGEDLDVVLKERGRLTIWESAPLIMQVADALEHVHKANIIHRDLKPSNLMITTDGRVKILDFGVAKDSEGADLTNTGAVIGTPHYMSPEQAAGKPASPMSDMYALGMIWYQLLVGRVPFRGSIPEVLHMHIAIQPPRVSEAVAVPEAVDALIARMLRKGQEERPQSFQDVINIARTAIAPPSALGSMWRNVLLPVALIAGGIAAARYGFHDAQSDWEIELPASDLAKGLMAGGVVATVAGAGAILWRILRAILRPRASESS